MLAAILQERTVSEDWGLRVFRCARTSLRRFALTLKVAGAIVCFEIYLIYLVRIYFPAILKAQGFVSLHRILNPVAEYV